MVDILQIGYIDVAFNSCMYVFTSVKLCVHIFMCMNIDGVWIRNWICQTLGL
jgi:hypothetical protein